MCKRIFKDQTSEVGEIPFFKIGTFGRAPDSYISLDIYNEYKHKYPYPEKGDVLISASGTIGRTVVYKGEDAYYQDSNIVWLKRNKNLLNNLFLEQYYNIIKWGGIEGSTIKRLYNSNILNTEINYPILEEQIVIGKFLKNIDQAFSFHQQELTTLKKTKQGFLQKMFSKEGETVPEVRFPGFSGEWEEKRLGDFAEILTGGTPKTKIKDYWEPKEIPWMSSGEINNKRLKSTDNKISQQGFDNSSARWVKENSVLIALAGQGKTRGTVAINEIKLTTNQSIAAIVPFAEFYFEFLFSNLEMRYFELRSISSGDGTRGGLNKKIISDIIIPSPSIEEQIQIGNFFKQLDKTITLQEQELKALQQTKKAFLQKMFV